MGGGGCVSQQAMDGGVSQHAMGLGVSAQGRCLPRGVSVQGSVCILLECILVCIYVCLGIGKCERATILTCYLL